MHGATDDDHCFTRLRVPYDLMRHVLVSLVNENLNYSHSDFDISQELTLWIPGQYRFRNESNSLTSSLLALSFRNTKDRLPYFRKLPKVTGLSSFWATLFFVIVNLPDEIVHNNNNSALRSINEIYSGVDFLGCFDRRLQFSQHQPSMHLSLSVHHHSIRYEIVGVEYITVHSDSPVLTVLTMSTRLGCCRCMPVLMCSKAFLYRAWSISSMTCRGCNVRI